MVWQRVRWLTVMMHHCFVTRFFFKAHSWCHVVLHLHLGGTSSSYFDQSHYRGFPCFLPVDRDFADFITWRILAKKLGKRLVIRLTFAASIFVVKSPCYLWDMTLLRSKVAVILLVRFTVFCLGFCRFCALLLS